MNKTLSTFALIVIATILGFSIGTTIMATPSAAQTHTQACQVSEETLANADAQNDNMTLLAKLSGEQNEKFWDMFSVKYQKDRVVLSSIKGVVAYLVGTDVFVYVLDSQGCVLGYYKDTLEGWQGDLVDAGLAA